MLPVSTRQHSVGQLSPVFSETGWTLSGTKFAFYMMVHFFFAGRLPQLPFRSPFMFPEQ